MLFTIGVSVTLIAIPGPSVYDAIAHGLTTIATGGFSPHADSIGTFDSGAVELAIIVGMVLGGTNFALHWRAVTGDRLAYWRDPEFRTYLKLLIGASVLVIALLWLDTGLAITEAIRAGVFNVVAIATSTGYGSAQGAGSSGDFALWVPAAQLVLLFLMVVGSSSGSTAGGLKVMRLQILLAHSIRSVRRSQQPHAVMPVKHGTSAVNDNIVSRMTGFFLLYLLLVLAGIVVLAALGNGLLESISGTIGALGNTGPALGRAGPTANFTEAFTEPGRLVLALYMLISHGSVFPIF